MKKKIDPIIAIVLLMILAILLLLDLDATINKIVFLDVFKRNVSWLENLVDTYTPLLIFTIIIVFIIWANVKLSVSITGCSFGGIDISLKATENEVKNNMRNFLNTKRSLFCIEPAYDNFYDVLASYYSVYEFLRLQLLTFENSHKKDGEMYKELQQMIKELNVFLTRYQSDYRRWYEKENEKEFIPLAKLQPNYSKYEEMLEGFKLVNMSMQKHAQVIGVNTF